jgi:hypothetical protein
MPPTYQQYKTFLGTQGAQGQGESFPAVDTALGIIKTAAVSFDHLTNSPDWDRFLSYIQAMVEEQTKAKEAWLKALTEAVKDEDIRNAQNGYHTANGALKALEQIVALPQKLKDSYDDIRERHSQRFQSDHNQTAVNHLP